MNTSGKDLRVRLTIICMTRIPFFIARFWVRFNSKPTFLMNDKERKAYEKALWRLS